MHITVIKYIKSIKDCPKGVAALEMALVAPVLIMMLLASADVVSYLIAQQKISKAAYTISNLITQMDEGLTESKVSDMMLSIGEVSKPFDLAADGKATVTTIIGMGVDGAAPDSYEVSWQRCYGYATVSNKFGPKGTQVLTNDIPANMIVTTSQIIVVADVVYNFTPIIGFLNLGTKIEYQSFFRPRLGSINNIINDAVSTSTC
ncbi:MAG: pilus assembly protein [Emcibacter sp.]|nr:pilus assembly protein [Emcibacter sp.]